MAEFGVAYDKTNTVEGGYTRIPNETLWGIDRRWNPAWPGWKLVDLMKISARFPKNLEENAELKKMHQEFFKTKYWDKIRLSEVKDQDIANEVYDTGVNMGPDESVEFLQRAYNALCSSNTLVVDGIMGPKTLSAVNGYGHPKTLLKCLNILQGYEYITLAETNSSQRKFLRGWLRLRVGL